MSKASDLARLMTSGSTAIHGEAGVTSSGSTGLTTNLQQGLAKAWGNLNGSGTPAFRDSLNMASVTDNGTGSYTPAYTNNMGSTNYSSSFFSHEDNFHTFLGQVGDDIATNNYKLPSVYHNGSNSSYSFGATDTTKYNIQFFGDLA